MRLDAHQHFWALSRGDYGWLTPDLKPIYRDFLPGDLAPVVDSHGISGTILVQAAPTVAETEFMLTLAAQTPFVKGVVGWVEFADADAPAQIARLARNPALVGLRPMIQSIAQDDWITRPDLDPAFDAVIAHDLTFDALVLPRHLSPLLQRLQRHPDLRVVIDHAAKPHIADGTLAGWAGEMAALAHQTSAFCKLSGLVTEAGADWTIDRLRPFVDHLLTTFGPDRLIWGSDWPVCTLAASYDQWVATTDALLSGLTRTQRNAILATNARRAYHLME